MTAITGRRRLSETLGVTFIPNAKGKGYRRCFVFAGVDDTAGGIVCRECGAMLLALQSHLRAKHGMRVQEYRTKHGANAPVMTDELRAFSAELIRPYPDLMHLQRGARTCRKCGVQFEVPKNKDPTVYCSRECSEAERGRRKPSKARIAILSQLAHGPLPLRELVQKTGQRLGATAAALTKLRKEGVAYTEPRGVWHLRRQHAFLPSQPRGGYSTGRDPD